MIIRSCVPIPITSDPSVAWIVNSMRRPSTLVTSASPVTRRPAGVAATWRTSTRVPSALSLAPRYGFMALSAAFGSDDETDRALGPGRNRLHWSFSTLRYISWFAAYPLEHLQAIIAVVPGKRWVIVLPHSTEGYGQTDELYRR